MGRPINNIYIGNVTGAGQQIVGYAWVAGDSEARLSYILKQRGTHSFMMSSVNGNGIPGGGQVYLVNGPITQAGQGNITVTPYGSTGNGAVATANLGISGSPTIAVDGTGSSTANYLPGEKLSLVGGTFTNGKQANVTVNSVTIRTISTASSGASSGSAYAAGDYFLFNGPNYGSEANVKVSSVNSNGAVTGLTVVISGVYTGSTLPANPVTATSQQSTAGVGATFNISWGLNTVSVANEGDYTALPSNPVSLTGSANGTGGKINVTYSVSSINVTAPGANYLGAPAVEFGSGNASATAVVSNGNVSTITLNSGGSGYTTIPNVTLVDTATVQYATKLTDRIVYTFDGGQYEWMLEGQTLPGWGWATIQSQ